jgi:pimeloyl-ACP methyl ester carboxylesterase
MATIARDRERPVLYLLCGLLSDEEVWREVVQRVQSVATVHTVAFDGLSSMQAMAARVLSRAPDRFALAGHSMGGRVALEVIRSEPQRITGLALLNTGVHPVTPGEPAKRAHLVRLARQQGMSALARAWLPPMLDALHPSGPSVVERLAAMVQRFTAESFAGQTQALLDRPDARSLLPDIRVPTLLMSATGDRWSPVAQHESMQELVPHAKLAVIDHAGHFAPIERSSAVARHLREWLRSLSKPERS